MTLKKGSFRMVHRSWWRGCRANRIRGNPLLVLLAVETGPWGEGHYTGCFRLGIYDIADYTGLTEAEVSKSIAFLERIGVIVFDRDRQVVYVKGMLARQSPNFATNGNNVLQGIVNHIDRMPEGSPAVSAFIEAQRNEPELYELLQGYPQGNSEGDIEKT